MKRGIVVLGVIAALAGGAYYFTRADGAAATGRDVRPNAAGGGFGGARLPMTVEVAPVGRARLAEELTVVGNLIGQTTIEIVPKVSGRLESVAVNLGDRVARGQQLAKIEDREILEQVKQVQASYEVSAATVRQREADLQLAKTSLERNRSLLERQLISKQTFDDTDARYLAAEAQIDLAKAQFAQSRSRLDELKINLTNTILTSPVSGFVGSRTLDPGAWVTPNSTFISVVDIGVVRLVANVVEKDLRRVVVGLKATVGVDALPGEQFLGRVARVAPVLDPTTRTAQIEVEIPNPQFRLKPGMYANVHFTVEERANVLVVPADAVVDVRGQRGVFKAQGEVARFHPIETGLSQDRLIEVSGGLTEGEPIITTGAGALREGDKIVLATARGGSSESGGARANGAGQGAGRSGSRPAGGQP